MNDIITEINAELEALRGWLEGNKLSLNVVKTQGMIISSRCKLPRIDLPSSSKPDLWRCGISGSLLLLLRSFLSNRK